MGEHSAISWTDHTFNPWWGCHKVSPGCKHCYADAFDHRLGGSHWGLTAPRRFFGDGHWAAPLRWAKAARAEGRRDRVFCSSMSDWAERHPVPEIARLMDAARVRLWGLIQETADAIDWLLLSKRPENFDGMLPWWGAHTHHEPMANVWLGVTAEDDEHAKLRIPILRATPAAVRFVSYEPALSAIDWAAHLTGPGAPDWVIFGDESGAARRPAELEWARATRDACAATGVAFHFKQWVGADANGIAGERGKGRIHLPILDGVRHAAFPEAR